MRIRYGSYTHAEGEVALSITNQVIESEAGDPISEIRRWQLQGELLADSEASMDSSVRSLLAAYSVDGKDLALLLSTGNESALVLRSSDCVGGTRVRERPSFPDFRGAGYVSRLPYSIVVEGEVDLTGGGDVNVVAFSETLRLEGGGAKFGMRETLNGLPIRQRLRVATIFRAVQSGEATGRFSYPTPPPPLFPSALVGAPTVERTSPRRRSRTGRYRYDTFTISWQYVYESAVPLRGNPNILR